MVAFDKILLDLVKPMVEDQAGLDVRQMPSLNENEIVLHVYAKSNDVARLIGRKGSMASSLRQMMSIASKTEDKKITIQFESL